MALDVAKLRQLLDDLEREASEATAAKADLDAKTAAANDAKAAQDLATETFVTEAAQKVAKMQEMIAELQAAAAEG